MGRAVLAGRMGSRGHVRGPQGLAMPWSRGLSGVHAAKAPGRWPVAVGGWAALQEVLSGVPARLAGVDWGLPAVQQPGAGQSGQRPAEAGLRGAGPESPGWLRAAEGLQYP